MLKHLKRVFVQFTPGDPKAASARELLGRVSSPFAKKSNPACVVEHKVDDAGGPPFVDLTFTDDEQRKLVTKELNVGDINRIIQQKAGEMEMKVGCRDQRSGTLYGGGRVAWQGRPAWRRDNWGGGGGSGVGAGGQGVTGVVSLTSISSTLCQLIQTWFWVSFKWSARICACERTGRNTPSYPIMGRDTTGHCSPVHARVLTRSPAALGHCLPAGCDEGGGLESVGV